MKIERVKVCRCNKKGKCKGGNELNMTDNAKLYLTHKAPRTQPSTKTIVLNTVPNNNSLEYRSLPAT